MSSRSEVRPRQRDLSEERLPNRPFTEGPDLRSQRSAGQALPLPAHRRKRAKVAYATRRVAVEAMATLIVGDLRPLPGDLLLARVEDVHRRSRLELDGGRRARLFPGDEIVVCFGHCYVSGQLEAEVPSDLSPCHLVAGSGVAARLITQRGGERSSTGISPLGLLGDEDGAPLNVGDWSLPTAMRRPRRPLTAAVVGTSREAGGSMTAAQLIRGLIGSGLKVGAAKVNGTAGGADYWLMADAGAFPVLDLTDVGCVSTYRQPAARLEEILRDMTAHLTLAGVDAAVLQIGDGLFQEETAALLRSAAFGDLAEAVVLAAPDAVGASAGRRWLLRQGLSATALSGRLTRSPLTIREARLATGMPVLDLQSLSSPGIISTLFGRGGVGGRTVDPADLGPLPRV